jgi:hypothetical protein
MFRAPIDRRSSPPSRRSGESRGSSCSRRGSRLQRSGGGSPTVPAAATEPAAEGFLPTGHLFRALIADPRWPRFSAYYRYYINTPGSNNAAAVSFGETIPLFRDHIGEKGKWGQWETGLQGGTFSIFDLDSQSFDLINTDFFVAGFVGYRFGDFSALGRIFHQSSHLGDEFLLRKTRPNRINLSYEGLDAKLSYDLPLGGAPMPAEDTCSTWIPRALVVVWLRPAASSRAHGPCGRAGCGPSRESISSGAKRTTGTRTSRCALACSSKT